MGDRALSQEEIEREKEGYRERDREMMKMTTMGHAVHLQFLYPALVKMVDLHFL